MGSNLETMKDFKILKNLKINPNHILELLMPLWEINKKRQSKEPLGTQAFVFSIFQKGKRTRRGFYFSLNIIEFALCLVFS